MTGTPLTIELLAFGVAVFGAIAGLWWRVEAKIDTAREKAGLTGLLAQTKAESLAADFSKYQTHVAETYITKQGMREVRDEIMGALATLSGNLGRINDRIDRFSERAARED